MKEQCTGPVLLTAQGSALGDWMKSSGLLRSRFPAGQPTGRCRVPFRKRFYL